MAPGKTAPRKRSPTLMDILSAMSTSIMLGGISMPSVPTAQTVPVARRVSYPFSNIGGRPKRARRTTEAPIIPVVAANNKPIIVTAIANPPFTRPKSLEKPIINWFAIPERSRSRPISTNIGRATITQFSITPQIRSTDSDVKNQSTPIERSKSTSRMIAKAVNMTASPPRIQATG